MQILAQDFLPIAERAGAICTLDMEATGTKGDYNSLLVVTVKPYHATPITLSVSSPGDDRSLCVAARDLLHEYPVWISYYGKGFDIPMLQSRLLRHGSKPLVKHHHIDMYWHMKAHTITARRSQAHLAEWLETPHLKMQLSAELWNEVLRSPKKALATLRSRCESDCATLEDLYDRCKHLIVEVTR